MGRRRSPPETILTDSTNISHEQAAASEHHVPRGEDVGISSKPRSVTFSRKGKVQSRASYSFCMVLQVLMRRDLLRRSGLAVLENVGNLQS